MRHLNVFLLRPDPFKKKNYKNINLSLRLVIFTSHVLPHRCSDRVGRDLDVLRIRALLSKFEMRGSRDFTLGVIPKLGD